MSTMYGANDQFLTEFAKIQGKGNGALAEWANSKHLDIIQASGDVTREEAITFFLGMSNNPVREIRNKHNLEYIRVSDKINYNVYFMFREQFEGVYDWAKEKLNPNAKKHAGHELGPREFTLTYSPDWFDDDRAAFLMKLAIEKLCGYYEEDIVYLRAVGERTKAGRVHVHCMYELKGGLKMTDKNMKRAYKNWNGKVHHHKTIQSIANFKGYIDKEIEHAWFKHTVDNRPPAQGGRVLF